MNGQTPSCSLCFARSIGPVIEANGYKAYQCSKCRLVFVDPMPTPDEVVNLYGHGLAKTGVGALIRGEYLKRRYAKYQLALLGKYKQSGALLEMGAGAGYFLDEARSAGFSAKAIELNRDQAQFITDTFGIECESEPLSTSSFGGQNFDVIYHCDVASHFRDPVGMFRLMGQKLKSGGILMFETGNLGDVPGSEYRKVPDFQLPDHLYFYSADNLRVLVREAGLEVYSIRRFGLSAQLAFMRWASYIRKDYGSGDGGMRDELQRSRTDDTSCISRRGYQESHRIREELKRRIYWGAQYLLRYRLGAIDIRRHKLQSVVVIAGSNRG